MMQQIIYRNSVHWAGSSREVVTELRELSLKYRTVSDLINSKIKSGPVKGR